MGTTSERRPRSGLATMAHGQVGGGLDDLQRGGSDAHAVLEEEIDNQIGEEAEALLPEPHPDLQPPPCYPGGTL
jgi:hypothetical protein